ncbi:DUF2937 family protein [Pseudomonas sp. JS3066]|jgi:hypothetical protein|uniref:DUF2937 family protein n=1 Tax=unclassified Pseudomonas TaxID=196821 RepID=UPI00129DC7C5|nr:MULTISPECIES: DUF2937 family protein [unclassified Pseudomonas]MDH4656456.1 DUF2937 family protein [Pseudomonas sp. BN606]MRK20155.1 DUF2937 family protein [Pseudomonas sp. JG-B]WVK94887.1 DUF2937 family protein [Pseudomonas sp. JS3066]
MLRSYLRLVLFTLGLLIGVQVPGFIDDYAKRVDAHRLEAEQGLKGFRETAQRFFQGDLNVLVEHYRASTDEVMRSDADSVAHLVARNDLMQREWQALQGPWYQRAWHVLATANPELRQETLAVYSYQLLLKPEAIAWGLSSGVLLAWVVESILLLIGAAAGVGRNRKVQQRHRL